MRDVFCPSQITALTPSSKYLGDISDQLYSPVSPVSAVHSKFQDKDLDRTWLTINYPFLFSTHTREVFSWVSVTSQWGQLLISPKKCTLCGYQPFKMYLWLSIFLSQVYTTVFSTIVCLLFSTRCSALFLIWLGVTNSTLSSEHVFPTEKVGTQAMESTSPFRAVSF